MSNNLQISITPGTVFINTAPGQTSYAKLTVTIKNTGTVAIKISGIAITLPATLAPVSSLGSILLNMDTATTALWSFVPSQFTMGEFDASPQSGSSVALSGGGVYTFILDMVTLPNSVLATSAQVTAAVTLADGTMFTQPLTVNMGVTVAAITFFNALPSTVSPGQPATLKWQCTGIDHCLLVPDGGSAPLAATGQLTVNPNATTAYTLYAYAAGVILAAQWEVTVQNPAILTFGGFHGNTVVNLHDTIQLVWRCNQFTQKVTITNNNQLTIPNLLTNGNTLQNGTVTVGPLSAPTTFVFTASNTDGSIFAQQSVTIGITDVTCSINASNTNVWQKDKVTLSWLVGNATGFSISPPLGSAPAASLGKKNASMALLSPFDIFPQASVTYKLTATGFMGNLPATITSSVSINVTQVVINNFSLSPQPIPLFNQNGNKTKLQWSTVAQVLNITPWGAMPSGDANTELTAPANGTTYTMTAGTQQNPNLFTRSVTVTNAYGPFTFNSFVTQWFSTAQLIGAFPTMFNITLGMLFSLQNTDPALMAAYIGHLMQVQFTGVTFGGQTTPVITVQAYLVNAGTCLFVPYSFGGQFVWSNGSNPTGTATIVSLIN